MRNDKIYTPNWLVNKMLDLAEFKGEQIWNKTILEPSFGDGAFLIEIVTRIIDYAQSSNKSDEEIYSMLNNIYGVELEEESYNITIDRLNDYLSSKGLFYNNWNLYCNNTLLQTFDIKFDYIFGNPPYVRVHNMSEEEKNILDNYSFSEGIPELYIVFMEYSLNLLNNNGIMAFVTPNNFFYTKSQQEFRNFLCNSGFLYLLINFGHVDVFEGIGVYSAVSLFKKELTNYNHSMHYINMLDKEKIDFEKTIQLKELVDKEFILHNDEDETFLQLLYLKSNKLGDYCKVLNAIQTNANSLYVGNFENKMEKGILKRVVKASDLGKKQGYVDIIFPYIYNNDKTYTVMSDDYLKNNFPLCYNYLLANRDKLDKRKVSSTNTEWFQYGRSQGISNMLNEKLVFKKYISNTDINCNVLKLDENTFVYSGIFIVPNDTINIDILYKVLTSKDFCRYCKLVGKDLSGGYKEITGNMIINYPVDVEEFN